jgi:hypothetical protein
VLTDDEELRATDNGAAAGLTGGSACGGEERVWGSGENKEGNSEPLGVLL